MLRLGDVLISDGKITKEQLNQAIKLQGEVGIKLGEALVQLGIITEVAMMESLAKSLGTEFVTLSGRTLRVDLAGLIPRQIAVQNNLIAYDTKDNRLYIAMSDPLNHRVIEDIKSVVNMPLKISVALESDIAESLSLAYKELDAKKITQSLGYEELVDSNKVSMFSADTPVVSLVNRLLLKAESVGASDIHLESFEKYIQIRLRVDGQLLDYDVVTKKIGEQISNRIKVMSGMKITENRLPQDGGIKILLEGIRFNIRVSILPTLYGEKIVMRLLNQKTEMDNSTTFGMSEKNYNLVQKMIKNPYGIIYLTGPTGSGKTTTLYMLLKSLKANNVNISTIEDPVEEQLERVNQSQVNAGIGFTFEAGLRSLLRQDPDVIMVGETRDSETAKISISAAITGHLVLSTLHTNDAIGAITRLEDMGIEPYLVGDALVGVVSQRLVRKICSHCKTKYELNDAERLLVGLDEAYMGTGCVHCNGTGYKGRIAVHEVLFIDSKVRSMIVHKTSIEKITEYVKSQGAETLQESILSNVREGITTVAEFTKFSYRAY